MAQQTPSTVKFLRAMASSSGGESTVRGQALLRAAARVIMMGEQLSRCETIFHSTVDADRIEAAAEAVYEVVVSQNNKEGRPSMPPWHWQRHQPTGSLYRALAAAALGLPSMAPQGEDEDAASPSGQQHQEQINEQ